jgi:myo-inositol-1(or 4)-monophosphatase
MTTPEIRGRVGLAIEVAREAARLASHMRADFAALGVETKGDPRDVVTIADRKVEEFIVSRLHAQFGDDVLGEEHGRTGMSERLWIVDPIDGTYNYVHDNPRWCVSMGFVLAGEPIIGVICSPASGQLFVAAKGSGATRNGVPIRVSGDRFGTQPLVEVGTSSSKPVSRYLEIVGRLMGDNIETRRLGSGALGLAQVATGETDGYVEDHIHPWDVAAGIVIVSEAGGHVSDFFAGGIVDRSGPILACTPSLRARLEAVVGTPTS